MGGYDTYEYNAHVALSLNFRFAIAREEAKVRQVRDSGIGLTMGRGQAVVDGTRRKQQEKRRASREERRLGHMLEVVVGRR